MAPQIDDHKQDLVILGVVCIVLAAFTVVAMMQSGPEGVGGEGDGGPAVLVAVAAPPGVGGSGTGAGGGGGGAGSGGEGASGSGSQGASAPDAPKDEPGTWKPSGDMPEVEGEMDGEVVEVTLDQIDLEDFDIVLPGGLVLPRVAAPLVERQPRGLCGLAVYDPKGTLYYASVDGPWTTVWAEADGKRRTVWCGETGEKHFEIVGLSGDEILLVQTDDEPFETRREAWDRDGGFHALRISKPGVGTYTIRLSKSLISAVLAYCD